MTYQSDYTREEDRKQRAICVASVTRLQDELDRLKTTYNCKREELEIRITDCQAVISKIDKRKEEAK